MMNEIKTRISLKYDSLANWIKPENQFILKAGEVAYVELPSNQVANSTNGNVTVQSAPTVLFKVGDGTHTFNELEWASAKAADVYEWAKAANKPAYVAGEIGGIDAYIADYVQEQMGISVDTDTQYQIVKVDDYNYKLQSKGKTDSTWVDVAGSAFSIPKYDDSDLKGRMSAAEGIIESLTGDGDASIEKMISGAISDLDLPNTYDAKGAAAAAEAEAKKYAKEYTDGLAGNYDAHGSAEAVRSALSADIAAEKQRAEQAESNLQTQINTIVNNPDTEGAINSINEFTQYVKDHGEIAEGFRTSIAQNAAAIGVNAGNIQSNAEAIEDLEELVGTKKVADQISEAIAAEKISETYATKAALNDTNGAVARAQAAADGAAGAASAAQGTADEAVAAAGVADGKAVAAQGTADEAVAAAGVADGKAVKAQQTADEAKGSAEAANQAIASLHTIATSGLVSDLQQTAGTYIIFNCGGASEFPA